ncbi:hypothetical protein MGL_3645 [Malassezia globosa CBS 7966]|uniref:Uncharacterized protein n=1 Tax=Malassezia globosa (strain ATCC MYA-4612 / CBS 7966) TaxID=425265 RepID=A8QA86_MALGO|nr:uncharacterized protein MGL_3645 [Malassezia globosa CBS 7966]EDP41964.1 hypothetical protein MGL_3645 [Malassezia globosa CBS 7966]
MTKREQESQHHYSHSKRRRKQGPRVGSAHQRHTRKIVHALDYPRCGGVFMSCARGKERKAASELIEVMEEKAQCMYGDVDEEDMDSLRNGPAPATRAKGAATPTSVNSSSDIETQIQQELQALRSTPSLSRFTALDTDTECCMSFRVLVSYMQYALSSVYHQLIRIG